MVRRSGGWKPRVTWAMLLTVCVFASSATAGWPSWKALGRAAVDSARDPHVWVPAAGAAAIAAAGIDDDLAHRARRGRWVFGDKAEETSEDLLIAGYWVFGSMLAFTPAEDATDWGQRGATGIGALATSGGLVFGIKRATGRTRPNLDNDLSFPSGHAAQTSVMMDFSRRVLTDSNLPGWSQNVISTGLYSLSASAGWSRVEAGKHHSVDVLVGNALGAWVSGFMYRAFQERDDLAVSYAALDDGGALTLRYTW